MADSDNQENIYAAQIDVILQLSKELERLAKLLEGQELQQEMGNKLSVVPESTIMDLKASEITIATDRKIDETMKALKGKGKKEKGKKRARAPGCGSDASSGGPSGRSSGGPASGPSGPSGPSGSTLIIEREEERLLQRILDKNSIAVREKKEEYLSKRYSYIKENVSVVGYDYCFPFKNIIFSGKKVVKDNMFEVLEKNFTIYYDNNNKRICVCGKTFLNPMLAAAHMNRKDFLGACEDFENPIPLFVPFAKFGNVIMDEWARFLVQLSKMEPNVPVALLQSTMVTNVTGQNFFTYKKESSSEFRILKEVEHEMQLLSSENPRKFWRMLYAKKMAKLNELCLGQDDLGFLNFHMGLNNEKCYVNAKVSHAIYNRASLPFFLTAPYPISFKLAEPLLKE